MFIILTELVGWINIEFLILWPIIILLHIIFECNPWLIVPNYKDYTFIDICGEYISNHNHNNHADETYWLINTIILNYVLCAQGQAEWITDVSSWLSFGGSLLMCNIHFHWRIPIFVCRHYYKVYWEKASVSPRNETSD